MQCGSCGEEIPADSIFCPECGARQDLSRAGGFTAPNAVGLSGQEVTGGRSFGVVSGEAIRHQRDVCHRSKRSFTRVDETNCSKYAKSAKHTPSWKLSSARIPKPVESTK